MRQSLRILLMLVLAEGLFALSLVPTASAEEEKQTRILIIDGSYPSSFLSGVSGYGESSVLDAMDVAKYSEEYLKENFDLFVVTAELSGWSIGWEDYPSLVGKLWNAVEAGKSIIIVTYEDYSSPANTVISNCNLDKSFPNT
ncbi:hypothetical protein [Thermococcus gammatolerans]|nr:hypothetical protein [Thermococcus gammatolerans]